MAAAPASSADSARLASNRSARGRPPQTAVGGVVSFVYVRIQAGPGSLESLEDHTEGRRFALKIGTIVHAHVLRVVHDCDVRWDVTSIQTRPICILKC